MDVLKRIALSLIIIGAINWGFIGLFNFDVVAMLFGGEQSVISRFIYTLVGLSGLYALTILFTGMDSPTETHTRARPDFTTEFSREFDDYDHDRDRNRRD